VDVELAHLVMPHPSPVLPAIARRDYIEKVMFGYVYGIRRGLHIGLPGLTDDRIDQHLSPRKCIDQFLREFGFTTELNPDSLEVTYQRMVKELHQDQRTKQTA